MSSRTKTAAVLVGVASVALLLTACQDGGAQNGNPVGKGPATDDPARQTCPVAAKSAVDAIDAAVGKQDDTDFASVQRGDGGWYLAASIVPNVKDDPKTDDVTVWATTADPTDEDFDGPLAPVNDEARASVSSDDASASAVPSTCSDDSDAAKAVAGCPINAANR